MVVVNLHCEWCDFLDEMIGDGIDGRVSSKGKIMDVGVSKNRGGPPKSSILIGFSIIFTAPSILGVFPLFLETSMYSHKLSKRFKK